MDRPSFEQHHGFVPVLRLRDGRRRSLLPKLANNEKWMRENGFIKIEKPQAPGVPGHATAQTQPEDAPVNLEVNQEFSPAREVPKPKKEKY